MSEQRELTLDEWVSLLPEFHLANKQYQQLQQRIEELEHQLTQYRIDNLKIKADNNEQAAEIESLKTHIEELTVYEYREIGESGWMRCTKEWFEYCQNSPELDTRKRIKSLAEHDAEVARKAILAAAYDYRKEYMGQSVERLLTEFADVYAKRIKDGER